MEITRRRALLTGLTAVGAVAVGTWPSIGDAPTPGVSRALPVAVRRPVKPRPVPYARAAWARHWHQPVSSIVDFERRVPGSRFPRHAVLLTVDDGPSPEWTPKYLALFARHGITATFCMIGKQVGGNRALVRDVHEHGHTIANHTWTHDEQLTYRPAARIRSEIERTNDAIVHATGVAPAQFRAPGGTWGPALFAELARQRMLPLGWDVDPADWSRPGTAAIEHAMLAARPHDIVLCHDGGGDRSETYRALRRVIPTLLDRGLTFTTLPTSNAR